jgi:hypothetical protein
MGKYQPLKEFLAKRSWAEVPMSFDEIEAVIGAPLPPKAQKHRAWWSNSASNNVMTRAWLDAGYRSERVDMTSRRLVFRRAAGHSNSSAAPPSTGPSSVGVLERLRRALGGTVRVSPGWDLTAPAEAEWDAEKL